MKIDEIVKEFNLCGDIVEIFSNEIGLINKSYIVITTEKKYIIQKINKLVFHEPDKIMNNIKVVTEHLNSLKKTCDNLKLIVTKSGKYHLVNDGEYYRCYDYINDSVTYNFPKHNKQLYELGDAIGNFHKDLLNLDVNKLHITIPNFHDTDVRFNQLVEAFINSDPYKQDESIELYKFVLDNIDQVVNINKELENSKIPWHIVHNDTKFNNLVFDKTTNKAKCLIDYDTVMPGSILFDFGDAMRSAAASVSEECFKYELIDFNLIRFVYFTIGYYYKMKDMLTEREIELLYDSMLMISFECGMRFLTDYLDNDKYFSVKFPKHNLKRSKNQFILSKKIIEKKERIKKIIKIIQKRIK